MFRSLRARMAASHAIVLAVILVVLGGTGWVLLSRGLDDAATSDLMFAAREQASAYNPDKPRASPDSDLPSRSAIRIGVFKPGGEQVSDPGETPSWLRPYAAPIVDLHVDGEPVRVVSVPVIRRGRNVATVVAARSLEAEDELLERVRLLLLIGGGVAVPASIAAGWWLAGRAVRPVQRAYDAQAGFAADASHELRTPLTFIRAGVEVLAEGDRELGGEVLGEIDYLTGLTQRLLMLARAERGMLTLDRAPFSIDEVCRSAVHRSERAHRTVVSIDAEPDVAALGDRVAAETALDVLLENLSVHGGGTGNLRWSTADGRVVVSVRDHGRGLPAEQVEAAFDRFFRLDPSRTRGTGGAGLGLSLARALLQAQGGRVWLEPTPGGGLTANVELPVAVEPPAAASTYASGATSSRRDPIATTPDGRP
jgi:two-component system, OmpR family, sensor histidine kinase CiaH